MAKSVTTWKWGRNQQIKNSKTRPDSSKSANLSGKQTNSEGYCGSRSPGEYSQWLKNDWNSLITGTKFTEFGTVNFTSEVFSCLWTDSVCSRRLPLISNHRKRNKWSYLCLQVRILKLVKINWRQRVVHLVMLSPAWHKLMWLSFLVFVLNGQLCDPIQTTWYYFFWVTFFN